VRVTADTNVLVRAVLGDDPPQARRAANALISADIVAVPLPVLCEFVWVLLRRYGRSADEIAASIRDLADSANVHLDRPAVDAGLAILEAGGDFADGVIAFEGRRLGGPVFASFDRRAVELIAATGGETQLLSTA
jgi:predicted nucleic-acid-binding protein